MPKSEYNKQYYLKNKEKLLQNSKKYRNKNRDTILAQQKQYRDKNREKIRAYDREKYAKHLEKFKRKGRVDTLRKYNLTPKQWDELFENQNKCCAICETEKCKKWNTDHDHATGRVRGILCHHCNIGLGLFKDHPELLLKAIVYLGEYQQQILADSEGIEPSPT